KIIRIVELETETTLTRKIISTIIKALSSHDNSNTLSILDATYIYSVSLFGPYTRFSILDSLPSNRLSRRRFQFGASNGHAAKLAVASKYLFLSCLICLHICMVHSGYGRSFKTIIESPSIYPSF